MAEIINIADRVRTIVANTEAAMAEIINIADRVRTIVANTVGKSVEDVTADKTFEQLNADSLDALEAIMSIELEFEGVQIDDENINMSSAVGDLIKQVESQANG